MAEKTNKSLLIEKQKLPTSVEFSSGAIKKALLKQSNNHWTMRYSIPLFAGSLVVGTLFGFTYPVFIAALLTFGFGSGSWVYNFFMKADSFEKNYIKSLHETLDFYTESKRKKLSTDLEAYNSPRGVMQLSLFQDKFNVLEDVLLTKFDTSQLTYHRYFSIAKEVFLSGIDNLSSVIMALKTINSIDLRYINKRLEKLKKEDQNNMAIVKEMDALNRSLKSHTEQVNKIQALLAENDIALSQIDETTIAISEITRSKNFEASIDMQNSMKALEEIAKRTKYYSR